MTGCPGGLSGFEYLQTKFAKLEGIRDYSMFLYRRQIYVNSPDYGWIQEK